MSERPLQQIAVVHPHRLETVLETALNDTERIARRLFVLIGVVRLQEIHGHRRNERPRKYERRHHREHDGFGHRHEKEPRNALQEEHRHEDDADAEHRHERRRRDLIGAVENCGLDVFALLEMVIDILDRHRCFIDKDTDRQRQAAKRHDVHRFAERRERRDRRQNRSGIEVAMMTVDRMLPRNRRIITLVSAAARMPSCTTLVTALRTKTD